MGVCDGGQTSGLCHVAVATPPSPKPTTEELDGDTRGVQCSASLSTGLLSKLRELGCIRLQIFENGSVARGAAGSSSQDLSSKGGGGSQSGARDWILGMCTFVCTSPSSPVSVLKLLSQAGSFIMLKMSLGQFFVHIYGLKVKKVHKSVVNLGPSLSVRRRSSALLSVSVGCCLVILCNVCGSIRSLERSNGWF